MQYVPIHLLCDFAKYIPTDNGEQFGHEFLLQNHWYSTEQKQQVTKQFILGGKFFHSFKQVHNLNLIFEHFHKQTEKDQCLAQYEMFLPLFSAICANSHKITNLSIMDHNMHFPRRPWPVFTSIHHFISRAKNTNTVNLLYHSNLVATRPKYINLESIKLNSMVLNKSFQASSKLVYLELRNVALSISFWNDLLNTSNIESLINVKTLIFRNNKLFCCKGDLEQDNNGDLFVGKLMSWQPKMLPLLKTCLLKFAQSLTNLELFSYANNLSFDPLWYYISDNQRNNKYVSLKTLKLTRWSRKDSSQIHSFAILNDQHNYNFDLNDVDIALLDQNFQSTIFEDSRVWDIDNLQNIKKILVSKSNVSNSGLVGKHTSNITKLRLQLYNGDYYMDDRVFAQTVFDTLSTQINFDKLLYFEYVEQDINKLKRLPQIILLLDQLYQTFPKYQDYGLLTKVELKTSRGRTGRLDQDVTKLMCNTLRKWYQNGLVDCKIAISWPRMIDNDGFFHKCVRSKHYFKKNNQLLSKQTKNSIIQRRIQHPMCANGSPFVAAFIEDATGYYGDIVVINAMTDRSAKHFKIEDYIDDYSSSSDSNSSSA